MKLRRRLPILILLCLSLSAEAKSVTVNLYRVKQKGHGASIGSVQFVDTRYGMLILPSIYGIKPGIHGFHVHQYASCADNGKAAGGHFDPKHTGKHLGPYNANGHLGDLPALTADRQGEVELPVLAPRVTVAQIKNHALILHGGGDNYSDQPKALGGGGTRVACGVIK